MGVFYYEFMKLCFFLKDNNCFKYIIKDSIAEGGLEPPHSDHETDKLTFTLFREKKP